MIKLFDNVKIKKKNLIGTVVDIANIGNKYIYTVESIKKGYVNDPDAYNGLYPLYQCSEDEIEVVK